jgi:AbrB family looped-hinge helix DNA binding protein
MATTTISSKGQVIIPKPLRESRRWLPGTKLELMETELGVLLRPLQPAGKVPINAGLRAIRARISFKGKALSIEQMNAAILSQAAKTK